MIRFLLSIYFVLSINLVFGTSIGVGFFTDEISVWRYWEKNETGYDQKIMILNTTDSIVEIEVKKVVLVGYCAKLDSSQTEIILEKTKIKEFDYLIFNMNLEIEPIKPGVDITRLISFVLNDKRAGAVGLEFEFPPEKLHGYKYVSPVGLNGGYGRYWVAKNNLFSLENKKDSITLMLKKVGEIFLKENEQYWTSLSPTNNFNMFEIETNGIYKFFIDFYNQYRLMVPYSTKIDSSTTSIITIKYNAVNASDVYLGLILRFWIKYSNMDDTGAKLEETGLNGYMRLPILIK